MKSGKHFLRLALILCLNLVICAAAAAVAFAADYESEIVPNGSASGELTKRNIIEKIEENKTDTYKVVLPSSGKLTVDLKSDADDMRFYLMNDSSYKSDKVKVKEAGSKDYWLSSGTYYLVFENHLLRWEGKYEVKLSFAPAAKTYDGVDNSSVALVRNGSAVPAGKRIRGLITEDKDRDVYKVALKESGRLSLSVHSDLAQLKFSLYDENSSSVAATSFYAGDSVASMDLAPGNYYLSFTNPAGGDFGSFSFVQKVKSAKETITYDNNTINLVRNRAAVPVGKLVRGQLALNDNADTFKYAIPKAGRYTLRLTSDLETVSVELCDSSDKTVESFEHSKGVRSYKFVLKKSTYYLRFSGSNTGTYKFKLTPAGVSLKSVAPARGAMKVVWNKGTGSGYELQYSLSKSFKKNVKTVRITKAKTTARTIKKLKGGKRYYVRVRSYVKSGSKMYRSGWSKVKSVKVKK